MSALNGQERVGVFALALGALARYPQLVEGSGLAGPDFPTQEQRLIFAAIPHAEIDLETGAASVGSLAAISGSAAAGDLSYAPNPEAAQKRVARARQFATHGACLAALRPLLDDGATGPSPASDLVARISELLEQLTSRHGSVIPLPTASQLIARWCQTALAAPSSEAYGYQLAIPELSSYIGNVHPGECVVIASRPGEGKTTIAVQIAEYWAEQGLSGLYFTAEMSGDDMADRLAHRLANRSMLHPLTPFQRQQVAAQLPGCAHLQRIKVHDCRRITMTEVRRLLLTEVSKGAGYFIVDNLKHVDSHTQERDVERLARTTRELRQCAGDLSIPVLILHHLSRRAEFAEQNDEDPTSAWLKGSGGIEEEADTVIFLQADKKDPFSGTEVAGKAEAIIVKARRTGVRGITVRLKFDKMMQRFEVDEGHE